MKKIRNMILPPLICIFVVLSWTISIYSAESQHITIAVVRDGPSLEGDIVSRIEAELKKLIPSETEVKFKDDPGFNAQWNSDRYRQVIMNALADLEVDILLLVGALVTHEAAKKDLELTKPTISGFDQRANFFEIPYEDDRSLKTNFSFILVPQRIERDMEIFQKITQIKTLDVAVNEEYVTHTTITQDAFSALGDKFGLNIRFVPVSGDLSASLAGFDESTQAVFIGRTPHISKAQRKSLINELTLRKIPTFSYFGHSDIEMGALAALAPDVTEHVVRRVALNLSELISGESTKKLPVLLTVDPKLLINGRTASELGFRPTHEVKVMATFLHEEEIQEKATLLTFEDALRKAEEGNTSLAIQDSQVETSQRNMQFSRSFMLPQVFANAGYSYNNPWGNMKEILPEGQTVAGVTLSQMIYDDQTISDYKSAKKMFEGSQNEREAQRLNVMTEAGAAFLNYSLAQVLYAIELKNLRLTEDNLDLARVRVDVGYAGRDEVYRWEAELAKRRSSLLDTESNLESQRIFLNQVLGVSQDMRWAVEEISIDPDMFSFLDGRVKQIFRDAHTFEKFRELMVDFAYENSPEMMFFEKMLEAQDIQLGQRKRKFFLPVFSLNLSYDYQISRTPTLTDADKGWFTFAVSASYPLFNSGAKSYDVKRVASQLETLKRERRLTQELIEKGVRTSIRRLENSFPSIRLNRSAAESALKNFGVVQEKYAQGIVNITDLLEAQTTSFVAEQNATISGFTYLLDLLGFQRSISWIEVDRNPEERNSLFERFQSYLQGIEDKE